MFRFKPSNIIAVDVYLERHKTRQYVGQLMKVQQGFHFVYDNAYFNSRNVIPLGPELPLTKKSFDSGSLFSSFSDRIPSRDNPAYPEYCASVGISPDETNLLILLSTIAKRGPSSFIFEPVYQDAFSAADLREFRQHLGLSIREFSRCFQFSVAAITRVELGQSSGRELLKRAFIYANFPNVAQYQIRRYGGALHQNKRQKVEALLNKMLEE